MRDAERRMHDFERWHRRPQPRAERSTAGDFESLRRTMRDASKRFEGVSDAWDEHAPEALKEHCALVGFAGGTLTVVVPNASVSFALDRALRAGLETTLRQATSGKLVSVRARVGAPDR